MSINEKSEWLPKKKLSPAKNAGIEKRKHKNKSKNLLLTIIAATRVVTDKQKNVVSSPNLKNGINKKIISNEVSKTLCPHFFLNSKNNISPRHY